MSSWPKRSKTLKAVLEQDEQSQLVAERSLFEETAFAFEDREAVAAALTLFETSSFVFADCLIVTRRAWQGCEFTATLDRGLRKLPEVEVL